MNIFELQLLRLIDKNDYFNDLMCPARIHKDMIQEYPNVTWSEIYPIMKKWQNENCINLRDGYWYVNWRVAGESKRKD